MDAVGTEGETRIKNEANSRQCANSPHVVSGSRCSRARADDIRPYVAAAKRNGRATPLHPNLNTGSFSAVWLGNRRRTACPRLWYPGGRRRGRCASKWRYITQGRIVHSSLTAPHSRSSRPCRASRRGCPPSSRAGSGRRATPRFFSRCGRRAPFPAPCSDIETARFSFRLIFRAGWFTMSQYTEGYRSGHNGAVLKTVRAKAHAGSNPAPSAKSRTPPKGGSN